MRDNKELYLSGPYHLLITQLWVNLSNSVGLIWAEIVGWLSIGWSRLWRLIFSALSCRCEGFLQCLSASLNQWASQIMFSGRCWGQKDRTDIAGSFGSLMYTSSSLPQSNSDPMSEVREVPHSHGSDTDEALNISEYFLKEEEYYFVSENKVYAVPYAEQYFSSVIWKVLSDSVDISLTIFSKPVCFF